MENKPVRLTTRAHFSAAHRLLNPAFSEEKNEAMYGRCIRQHGHNYQLEVTVRGTPDQNGMAMDLSALEATINAAVLNLVDHRDLNDVPALGGVITTGENLVQSFWRMLSAALPPGALHRVAVIETAKNRFEYFGDGIPPKE